MCHPFRFVFVHIIQSIHMYRSRRCSEERPGTEPSKFRFRENYTSHRTLESLTCFYGTDTAAVLIRVFDESSFAVRSSRSRLLERFSVGNFA